MSRGYDWQNKLASTGTPSTWLPLAKYNKYVYGKVARLMQKLDALGALDSVLIYVTSELGNPNLHISDAVPDGAGGRRQRAVPLRAAPEADAGLRAAQRFVHVARLRSSRTAPTTTCWSRSRRRSAST